MCTWRTSAKERFGLSALLMGKHPGPMQQGQRPTMSERSRPTATSRPYRSSLGSHPPPLSPILSFPFALAFALPLAFDAGSPNPSNRCHFYWNCRILACAMASFPLAPASTASWNLWMRILCSWLSRCLLSFFAFSRSATTNNVLAICASAHMRV